MGIRTFFVVILAFAAMAGAQRQGTAGGEADQLASKRYGYALVSPPKDLKDQLKLTQVEQKEIDSINAKYDAKPKAAFQAGQNQPPDMQRLQPLFEGRWKDLYVVLTTKQKAILKKWVDAHFEALRRKHP